MRRCCWPAMIAVIALGCGYRPLRGELPGGLRRVAVRALLDSGLREPALPNMLVRAVSERLLRAGVGLAGGDGAATLRLRVLAVDDDAALAGGQIAATRSRLRVEATLRDRFGERLWHSGALIVRHSGPLPSHSNAAAATRAGALRELAAEAAAVVVDRLLR